MAAYRVPSDRQVPVIRDWPIWAQVGTVIGWCAFMGALGGWLIGLVLYRWKR